jgi:molybdenum cofactor biosynthesis enzyme MoaA
MRIKIYPNYFAPKCLDRNQNFDTRNSHAIYSIPCNFRCGFCKNGVISETANINLSLEEFESTIIYLMESSTMFKFTGGEPTLLPELSQMIKIVKKHNGTVFLDSNGSKNDVIASLIKENLIDVLGLSIKGLSPETASLTSGVKRDLCWDNVINSIRATREKNVRLIVTFVVYDGLDIKKILDFLDFLHSLNESCYFKINNLYGDHHRTPGLQPLTSQQLKSIINEIIIKKPEWKEHLILVESFDSVRNFESIQFF